MNLLRALFDRTPYLGDILRERARLRVEHTYLLEENARLQGELDRLWMPPGHFYSPIPDLDEVRARADSLFDATVRPLPGIDLNESRQRELLECLVSFYDEQPFSLQRSPDRRYFADNPNFFFADAIILYGMMRCLRPGRILEVGSGYSSCVILDTNELFFDYSIRCTHIEPNPELLHSLLRPEDFARIEIMTTGLQDVPLNHFDALGPGDILFIDSTHVAKVGSDVNHLFSQILPRLRDGVYIHLHDVFYPFEYPADWFYEGRAWNEVYVVRAFLQYNDQFHIQFFNSYMERVCEERFQQEMPLYLHAPGSSLWLKKGSGETH